MKTTLVSKQHLQAEDHANILVASSSRSIPRQEVAFELWYSGAMSLGSVPPSPFADEEAPDRIDRLIARYPYMFSGDHIGWTLFRGWTPVLEAACERIDELLPSNKLAFRWVELSE
jgi:hypothetical protein